MKHLSLFSGIGGLDLAAEWAGFETVGQCEWADYPQAILAKHWPNVPKWRDIRTLTKESFYEQTGLESVDIISGGFPCQPFSTAGKRRGTKDDRYLWPEMLRVISEIKPTWVIGENVAGLLSMVKSISTVRVEGRSINRLQDEDYYEAIWSSQENMLLVALIRELGELGYEVQPFVIPACAVGAPHRRDRIALVAYNDCRRHVHRESQEQPTKRGKYAQPEFVKSRCAVCHSTSEGLPHRAAEPMGRSGPNAQPQRSNWWAVEPNVGRVAHGIPNRVDRLKCLGNAVVPQQFYPIFKAIHDIEAGTLTPDVLESDA